MWVRTRAMRNRRRPNILLARRLLQRHSSGLLLLPAQMPLLQEQTVRQSRRGQPRLHMLMHTQLSRPVRRLAQLRSHSNQVRQRPAVLHYTRPQNERRSSHPNRLYRDAAGSVSSSLQIVHSSSCSIRLIVYQPSIKPQIIIPTSYSILKSFLNPFLLILMPEILSWHC